MASTYTSITRLEKQGDGENPNTWGLRLNQNALDLVDQALGQYTSISVSSVNVTLTANNGAADQARSPFIELIGAITTSLNVVIPNVGKSYVVNDKTTRADASKTITLKTASGSGTLVKPSRISQFICDSVSVHPVEAYTSVAQGAAILAGNNTFTGTNIFSNTTAFTSAVSFPTSISVTELRAANVSVTELRAANVSVTGKAYVSVVETVNVSASTVYATEFYRNGFAIGPIEGSQLTPTTASVDFTAPRTGITGVTVMFDNLSANGASAGDVVMVQIGDAGGVETTGYEGWVARIGATASAYSAFSTGYEISQSQTDTTELVGTITLSHVGSNTWSEAGNISSSASTHNMQLSAGVKSLSAELTTVRITTLNGTILFDAGTVNVIWHFGS